MITYDLPNRWEEPLTPKFGWIWCAILQLEEPHYCEMGCGRSEQTIHFVRHSGAVLAVCDHCAARLLRHRDVEDAHWGILSTLRSVEELHEGWDDRSWYQTRGGFVLFEGVRTVRLTRGDEGWAASVDGEPCGVPQPIDDAKQNALEFVSWRRINAREESTLAHGNAR